LPGCAIAAVIFNNLADNHARFGLGPDDDDLRLL
jgi:hypothetical protein